MDPLLHHPCGRLARMCVSVPSFSSFVLRQYCCVCTGIGGEFERIQNNTFRLSRIVCYVIVTPVALVVVLNTEGYDHVRSLLFVIVPGVVVLVVALDRS